MFLGSAEIVNLDRDRWEAVHCRWDPLVLPGKPPIELRVPLINADSEKGIY